MGFRDLQIEAPQQLRGGDPDLVGTFRSELQRKSGAEIPIWSGRSDAKRASRMGLRDAPFPSLASRPQLLLFSKLKAPINRAESTLLQVFFLKNLNPIGINTFEKQGEGSPLWLTNCSKKVSSGMARRNPNLPFSVHTSKFRIPQVFYLPLLRKH